MSRYCPKVNGGAIEAKILSLMHDTCNTANLAATKLADLKRESLESNYSAEEIAGMSKEQVNTLDFLCANHTRQLPVAAYRRRADTWLADELKEDIAKAKIDYPNARLETTGSSFLYSIQKLIHCGYGSYYKGHGHQFRAWLTEAIDAIDNDEHEHDDAREGGIIVGTGRAGIGSRHEGLLRTSWLIYPNLNLIMDYTNTTRSLDANVLCDSVYVRVSHLANHADTHTQAIMYHVVFHELMTLTNHNDININPLALAKRHDELWAVGVMLQDEEQQMNIFDVAYRPFERDEALEKIMAQRNKCEVEKAGPKTGTKAAPAPKVGPAPAPIAVSEKVKLWDHIGKVLRADASNENEDWEKYEPLLRKFLTMFGEGIHESLSRTCSDLLTVKDGKYSEGKADEWMKAVAVYCVAHNNAAERPFAVSKFMNHRFPGMKLTNTTSVAAAMVNNTYGLGAEPGKTAKTIARAEASGGAGSGQGAAMSAPQPLQLAVYEVTKRNSDASLQRREYDVEDRAKQTAEQTQRNEAQRTENERLAAMRMEKQNAADEHELMKTAAALESRISACETDGAKVEVLKQQVPYP